MQICAVVALSCHVLPIVTFLACTQLSDIIAMVVGGVGGVVVAGPHNFRPKVVGYYSLSGEKNTKLK